MPNKSFSYYLRTVKLKFAGLGYALIDAVFKDNKNDIHLLTARFFGQNNTEVQIYTSFEFFRHPNDLDKYLYFHDGIAFYRSDSPYKGCSPLMPSYYGLVCMNHFMSTNDQKYYDVAEKQFDFLVKFGTETSDGFFLFYETDFKKFQVKGKWYAGITQAEMLSLGLRIYRLNPSEKLKLLLTKLVNSLQIEKKDGGILIQTPEGLPWIEEYPGEKPSYVLNGFIFCIIALLEYEQLFPNEEIRDFNNKLIESLLKSLPFYQRGKYFKYSRMYPTLSNIEYQGVYVAQFKHLYELTNLKVFEELFQQYNRTMNWKAFCEFYEINFSGPLPIKA